MNQKENKKYQIDAIPFDKVTRNDGVIPTPLRLLIIGTSGCGKTTLLYNLMYKEWGIKFEMLYIFSKSLEQNFYRRLQETYDKLTIKNEKEIAFFYGDCEEIISVDECEPNSLIVFDDCVNTQQQNIIKDYFVRGRHKNISSIYLTQSFSKIDRQLIRNNLNLLCVFKQDNYYLKQIYESFVGSDFSIENFKKICGDCWNEAYGFLTIYPTRELKAGKYRKKFQETII